MLVVREKAILEYSPINVVIGGTGTGTFAATQTTPVNLQVNGTLYQADGACLSGFSVTTTNSNTFTFVDVVGVSAFPDMTYLGDAVFFPALKVVQGNLTLPLSARSVVSMPNLQAISGVLTLTGNSLETVDLSSLEYANSLDIESSGLSSIAFDPDGLTCPSSVYINAGNSFTGLTMPAIQASSLSLACPALADLSMTGSTYSVNIDFGPCALSQASVDGVLAKLVAINWIGYLTMANANAEPSDAGKADAATLIARGCSLSTTYVPKQIVHYSFDDSTISLPVITDLSGNGVDGVVTGTPVSAASAYSSGQALTFSGAEFIDLADHGSHYSVRPGNFSVACWIRNGSSVDPDAWQNILTLGTDSPGEFIRFALGNNGNVGTNGIGIDINGAGLGISGFNDDAWHHLIATNNGDNWAVYLNGSTYAQSSFATATTLNGTMRIAEGWVGSLDDLIVFDSALTDAQASALFASYA